ncbi:energy-coupling factor ABC transporter ATP-binding protein [Paenibacillus elgii]|uniref:Energy-coupling factor ABC transporter ATP-binding protein n=1 Tax=Paenibacillus elgii TaxID=189691 RepID=A0A163UDJ7_9BACL|nr:ATP-binding cassette domain-containing protein [Paenibacillus elgii]KZE73180.1 energy-coupling factor ABC transporter ATP-binding protein [Paenibacillus elgii]
MISIRNVSFSYTGGEPPVWALRDVSLELEPGEFVAFLGPNGSGKSSLTRLLNGIELPTEGSILVEGDDTADPLAVPSIRRRVQIVFQNPENQQVGLTVGEDIAFGLSNIGWPQEDMQRRIRWALNAVRLDADEDRLVTQLSGGEKQKLALASVLALAPRCLILDEATSMLDPVSRKQFVETLHEVRREHPFTLIYITHHLEEVFEADRWVLFRQGGVQAVGKPAELWTQEELLSGCGLELPYPRRLALAVRKLGVPVSDSPGPEEWRKLLCASS